MFLSEQGKLPAADEKRFVFVEYSSIYLWPFGAEDCRYFILFHYDFQLLINYTYT